MKLKISLKNKEASLEADLEKLAEKYPDSTVAVACQHDCFVSFLAVALLPYVLVGGIGVLEPAFQCDKHNTFLHPRQLGNKLLGFIANCIRHSSLYFIGAKNVLKIILCKKLVSHSVTYSLCKTGLPFWNYTRSKGQSKAENFNGLIWVKQHFYCNKISYISYNSAYNRA